MTSGQYSIIRSAALLGALAVLAKFVSFLRVILFASILGASDTVDVYNAAFRIPDFFYNLLILGTLSVAFIPVYIDYYIKDKREANRIANIILNATVLGMGFLLLILYFLAPVLTKYLVPGFSGQKLQDTIMLTRFFLASSMLFTASSVFWSILNAAKKFFFVSIAPVMYNFGIIIGVVFFYPSYGIKGLAYGVILGAAAQFVLQLLAARNAGFSFKPELRLKHPGVVKISRLLVPRILGIDVGQFSLIISTVIGSTLAAGSISDFTYAYDLQFIPVGIFAVSFAIAAFPKLSENFATGNDKDFEHTLVKTAVNILFLILPVSVLFMVLRAQIVRVVYGHGNFDFTATKLVANSVGYFALSLFAQSLAPLFARAFYARQNTKTPMFIGFASMAVNIYFSYYLSRSMGVLGLAAGFSIASVFNTAALYLALRFRLKHLDDKYLIYSTMKIILSSLLAGITSYIALWYLSQYLPLTSTLNVFVQGAIAGLAGILAFIVSSLGLNLEQTRFVVLTVLKKTKIFFGPNGL